MVGKYFKNPIFLATLICIFFVYSGVVSVPRKNTFHCVLPQNDITVVCGVIASSPQVCGNKSYYSAELASRGAFSNFSWGTAYGNVTVYIPAEIIEAYFPGKLYSSSKKLGGSFIEKGTQVYLRGAFKNGKFYAESLVNHGYGKDFISKVQRFRGIFRLQFKRLMYGWKEAGSLFLALMCGAREYLPEETSTSFKNAGLSHVLALSGMHLSIISGIAVFVGSWMRRKKLSQIIQLLMLMLFVWFAGFSPSLLRAFICCCIMLLQEICGVEKTDSVIVLCFAFIAQTIISPNDLQSIGFILSYTALGGILLTSEFFKKIYTKFMPEKLASGFAASTGAQTFTMPVSAKIFGSVAPVGIVASVVISPFVTIFIYTGIIFMILSLIFPVLMPIGAFFMKIQYNLITMLVSFFAAFPAITFG